MSKIKVQNTGTIYFVRDKYNLWVYYDQNNYVLVLYKTTYTCNYYLNLVANQYENIAELWALHYRCKFVFIFICTFKQLTTVDISQNWSNNTLTSWKKDSLVSILLNVLDHFLYNILISDVLGSFSL